MCKFVFPHSDQLTPEERRLLLENFREDDMVLNFVSPFLIHVAKAFFSASDKLDIVEIEDLAQICGKKKLHMLTYVYRTIFY